MKKIILTTVLTIVLGLCMQAQVTNYALRFEENSTINCKNVSELNELNQFTIQFWLNPSQWKSGATIFSKGEGSEKFSCSLGAQNQLVVNVGSQKTIFSSSKIVANRWTQITMVGANNSIKLYLNNRFETNKSVSNLSIAASKADFILGGGFVGRIDEFRIWGKAIKTENFLWRNSLNKYHPDWSSLIVYYKFDQDLCVDNIVDYTYKHHGFFSQQKAVREAVKDNKEFVYRINSAYTEFSRWSDRKVDREKYLMANDIIVLALEIEKNGHVPEPVSNNPGVVTNGKYLESFEGRTGVLSLNGNGYMTAGPSTLDNSSERYSFHTWMYLDEWVENSYLFKKESSDTQGFSIRFGNAASKEIIVRINGNEFIRKIPKSQDPIKKWFFIGVSTNIAAPITASKIQFVFGNNPSRGAQKFPKNSPTTFLPKGVDNTNAIIGLKMKGKLDETAIWKTSISYGDFMRNKAGLPFPSNSVAYDPHSLLYIMNAAWKYDKKDDLGYDTYSYKNIMETIRSNFKGHRGYKLRMAVVGRQDGAWVKSIAIPSQRARMAADLARFGNEYDGIDLDLEWCCECGATNTCWTNYGKLVEEIRAKLKPGKLLSVSPHGYCYGFPKDKMKYVDFFGFQIYGPQSNWFSYSTYANSYNNFINYGFPAEKIVMSYAAITSSGYSNGSAVSQPIGVGYFANPNYKPNMDSYVDENGRTFYVTGVNQTIKRAELMQEKKCGGIFYWDMGNDIATSHPNSVARASNFAISSNVDSVVVKATNVGTSVSNYKPIQKSNIEIFPNPASDYLNFKIDGKNNSAVNYNMQIMDISGKVVKNGKIVGNEAKIVVGELKEGIYLLRVSNLNRANYQKTFIVK